jgi:hypothetical protein
MPYLKSGCKCIIVPVSAAKDFIITSSYLSRHGILCPASSAIHYNIRIFGKTTPQFSALYSGSLIVQLAPPVFELELTFDLLANASGMIGGDASILADWNTAFNHPPTATPFTAIDVAGNVVTLKYGANIVVPDGLFSTDWDGSGHLISVVDTGCLIEGGYNSFGDYDQNSNATILETAILPAMVTAGEGCFYYSDNYLTTTDFTSLITAGRYCFAYNYSWIDPDFSSLEFAGDYCFDSCDSFVTPDFSGLKSIGHGCYNGCVIFTSLSFPNLLPESTSLGESSADNAVFSNIINLTTTLTVPAYFETNNGGNPDGDITAFLAANPLSTVVYV